nr:RagB/SusD family nutrient uptake outer membrane protein [uncultured Pedobacter sp.]
MKKNLKNIAIAITGATMLSLALGGCKDSFFDRPPQSAITVDNFYSTDDQVQASTNVLYSAAWFGWVGKTGWAVTELAGGNGRTVSGDVVNFGNYSVTPTNFQIEQGWNALYIVVAQANGVINNLPTSVAPSVSQTTVNVALGEAHLFRALAYFHLVRTFGNVPLIEDSEKYIKDYQVNTAPIPDLYKFIVSDLKFAEENLPAMMRSGKGSGRVSSGSASALLAKVYLYMQDYTNAKLEAEKVINSGEFKLYGTDVAGKSYEDLFLTENNNNEESVIQLQWLGSGGYGLGNPTQAAFAYNGITLTGDGYGLLGPTPDLQDLYDPGDLRRHATIMFPGDFYPNIHKADGGYTFPLDGNAQGTRTAVKKYVVGSPADNGGVGSRQSAANNTYMMRYSEVYLILAEAIMAGAPTSTDLQALAAINKIRNRAGLGDLTEIKRYYTVPNPALNLPGAPSNTPTTLIKDDILDERRREFAFENDTWFDLARRDGFNVTTHPIAIAMVKQQDRGQVSNDNPPKRFGDGYNTNINDASFYFPYPATEVATNPKLLDAPVPYNFN